MAKKKNEEQINADMNQMQSEQEQMMINQEALAQIQAIENKTKMMQQESQNKSHDTEFSAFAESNTSENIAVIGEDEIRTAMDTLLKYKANKVDLEQKLRDNEQFWKMNHWDIIKGQEHNQALAEMRIKPRSAWLVNTILNKHADAMDNYPEPNILARSADDEKTAKLLSEIIPVILEQNDYDTTYSEAAWEKNKNGGSVQGIFWNNDKANGLGDIEIKNIDTMQLYWKSGIEDIQDSPNVFHVQMMDNDEIKARWSVMEDLNDSMPVMSTDLYNYGESVDTTNMSAVIDWYYKRRVSITDDLGIPQMKTLVHYCKFCNGKVLYASENDPNYAESGWYSHGQYPFVVDKLFPVKSQLIGMGYIDLIADDQIYIDKMQQAILESAIANARPRYAVRNDGSMNEEEFLDISNPVVHFDGSLGEDSFREIHAQPLNNIYQTVLLQKQQEMKDTSGNTATSQGQVSSVTTASGIASLTENAGKLSRDSSQNSYRAFKKVVYQVIELIRQFYTEPRCFRIVGEMGQTRYENFDNRGLAPQNQGTAFGIDLGSREPIMDIEVRPQKKSAYSKETQNQTALNLYNMGFFAPNNADASLACLNMMDFDGVEKIREAVANNGLMYQQLMAMQQALVQAGLMPTPNGASSAPSGARQGGAKVETSKGSQANQAVNNARESTTPR